MYALAAVSITAFLLCLITTPLICTVFSRAKLLDHPDEKRKLHGKAMPRVGGIAIVSSFTGALALTPLLVRHNSLLAMHERSLSLFLLPSMLLIFLIGLIDDLRTLKPWQKLLGQAFAAGITVTLGGRIALHHGSVWLSCGISFLWLVVCSNAFNLIDGIDGLAAGIALFASVATLISAMLGTNATLALAAAALTGCLLAFLRYNFPPASIFLGDCGSLTIGFILGCFGLNWSESTNDMSGFVAPLIMLSLPLLDVVLALARRFLRSTPLLQGDRHHIHHKVLSRTLTTRKALLILYSVSGLTATLSLLLSYSQPWLKWAVLFLFSALAIAGIASLRYIEFSVALRSICRRSIMRIIKEEIYLEELSIVLSKAKTVDAVWDIACIACEDLQVNTLGMTLCDRSFYIAIKAEEDNLSWVVTAPLGQQGQLSLTRSSTAGQTRLMAAVLERLQLSISQKEFSNESRHGEEPVFSYQGAA